MEDAIELLMAVTDSSAAKCRQALTMAQGDADRAMGLLLDGVVDAIGVDADFASFAGSYAPPPASVAAPAPSPPPMHVASSGGSTSPVHPHAARVGSPARDRATLASPPAQAPPRPAFHFGQRASSPSGSPPAGGAASPAGPGSPVRLRPVFRFGASAGSPSGSPPLGATASGGATDAAVDSPRPRPTFRFGASAGSSPRPAATQEPEGSGGELARLNSKVEEKRATLATFRELGVETSGIEAEIAALERQLSGHSPVAAAPSTSPQARTSGAPLGLSTAFGGRAAGGGSSPPSPHRPPAATAAAEAAAGPPGLEPAIAQLASMGFPEERVRQLLLRTLTPWRTSIGEREIQQVATRLLSCDNGDSSDDNDSDGDDGGGGVGGGAGRPMYLDSSDDDEDPETLLRRMIMQQHHGPPPPQLPSPPRAPGIDPSDAAATDGAIDDLMAVVVTEPEHRTPEYRSCFRILLSKPHIGWSVGDAAEWLYSRAGESQPVGRVIATLPVLFGVRARDEAVAAAAWAHDEANESVLWEWADDGDSFTLRRGLSAVGENIEDGWNKYEVDVMRQLDAEYAKGAGVRGSVIVSSGAPRREYLIDTSTEPMTQTAVQDPGGGGGAGGGGRVRQVRRREQVAVCGPLAGRGQVLRVQVDPGLAGRGDTVIVPQSYYEQLRLFTIGRRNRAAVYRISVEPQRRTCGAGSAAEQLEAAGAAATPPPVYCGGVEFLGQEGYVALPPWMAAALQPPPNTGDGGDDDDAAAPQPRSLHGGAAGEGWRAEAAADAMQGVRVRVEPWLLPPVKRVKLRVLSDGGFEEMVKHAAAQAGADAVARGFDVTTVLAEPLSEHYTTLTTGTVVPIVCADGNAYEFQLLSLQDSEGAEVPAVDLKSVFHAEVELELEYLSSDIDSVLDKHPELSRADARAALARTRPVPYDLLGALQAEEGRSRVRAKNSAREHARLVKSLCVRHGQGLGRSAAEGALAAHGWDLDAAFAALSRGGGGGGGGGDGGEGGEGGEGADSGDDLRRMPSKNTLRNRRLDALGGGGGNGGGGVAAAAAMPQGHSLAREPEPEPQPPQDEDGEDDSDLRRMPSTNTLRSRRLAALGSPPPPEPTTAPRSPAASSVGGAAAAAPLVPAPALPLGGAATPPPPTDEAAGGQLRQEACDEGAELYRLPSNNTLRNERLAALERRQQGAPTASEWVTAEPTASHGGDGAMAGAGSSPPSSPGAALARQRSSEERFLRASAEATARSLTAETEAMESEIAEIQDAIQQRQGLGDVAAAKPS